MLISDIQTTSNSFLSREWGYPFHSSLPSGMDLPNYAFTLHESTSVCSCMEAPSICFFITLSNSLWSASTPTLCQNPVTELFCSRQHSQNLLFYLSPFCFCQGVWSKCFWLLIWITVTPCLPWDTSYRTSNRTVLNQKRAAALPLCRLRSPLTIPWWGWFTVFLMVSWGFCFQFLELLLYW